VSDVDGFPDGFVWGTTASSVAVEGAAPASDWARAERLGRHPASGEGNGWATNYADDAQLLASLGLRAIRVTVEWARLEPTPGRVDGERVEHERRVLAALRDAGLQPWITLQHTSLPGWFGDDEGGFRDERARAYYWPRHVDRCGEWFEDLAAGWVPIEDPVGWALRAYLIGTRPPGRQAPDLARDAVIGALDANHAAWRILRGAGAPVMCALGARSPRAKAPNDPDDKAWFDALWNAPVHALRDGIVDVPGGAELERPEMEGSFDVVGVSFAHRAPAGSTLDTAGAAAELSEVLRRLAEELPNQPLAVTAHGIGTDDDKQRESLLRSTVDELRLVVRDGIDLRGWFHDTGVDGYDFATGFALPRGLVTRDRRVKDSGAWLQDLLA
jgi:beta-glucosidase